MDNRETNIMHRKLHREIEGDCRIVEFDYSNENHIRHLARYIFAARYCNGKRVLDLASGTGYGAQTICENSDPDILVIADISLSAVKYAKQHYGDKILKLCADAVMIPFRNEAFEVFISFETLEHIPEYETYLSEIVRVLKKGGCAIISTPNKMYRSPYTKKPRNPYHFIEWRKDDFMKILNEYFDKVNLYGQFVPKYPLLLSLCSPLFDTTLYRWRYLTAVMVRFGKIVRRYFGASKYPENETSDYIKKHEVRTINENDQPEIFVAVCQKI